jgi:hypothetical protein
MLRMVLDFDTRDMRLCADVLYIRALTCCVIPWQLMHGWCGVTINVSASSSPRVLRM